MEPEPFHWRSARATWDMSAAGSIAAPICMAMVHGLGKRMRGHEGSHDGGVLEKSRSRGYWELCGPDLIGKEFQSYFFWQ